MGAGAMPPCRARGRRSTRSLEVKWTSSTPPAPSFALLPFSPLLSVEGPLSLGLPEPPVASDDDQRIAAVREPVPWIEEELHLRRDLLSLKVEGIDAGSPESPPPLRFSCRRPPPPCKLGNDSGHPDLAARTVALRVRPPSSRTFP